MTGLDNVNQYGEDSMNLFHAPISILKYSKLQKTHYQTLDYS